MDLAVRDLLATNADPFSLANYLWVIAKHDVSLVNGDRLHDWGIAWVRRVLLEGETGRRVDEEISAAALASATLVSSNHIVNRTLVVKSLDKWVNQSTVRDKIPFGNPTYAAAMLVGASRWRLETPAVQLATDRVVHAFERSIPKGRLLGIGFVAEIVNNEGTARRRTLRDCLILLLSDAALGFEDRIYAAQGLCRLEPECDEEIAGRAQTLLEIELVVSRSPVWSYLMSGLEDIEPAGDNRVPVFVSHLYRAALFDVVLTLLRDAAQRHEAQLDARLRGRAATGAFAFIGIAFSLSLPWIFLVWLMLPSFEAGRNYWLRQEYSAMEPKSALLFFGGSLGLLLLAIWTPAVLFSLWKLLVRSAVESDRRISSVVRAEAKSAVARWVFLSTAIVIALLAGPLVVTLGRL